MAEVQLNVNHPQVQIEMDDGSIIKMELYPEYAPITVDNFIELVDKGFYNGLTFHRIIPGFMIQGGCPLGTGTGNSGKTIKGEFRRNQVENPIAHERGIVSMARSMSMDSASCQFFIMHKEAPHLNGEYAAFGKVIKGIEVVDKIASVDREINDKPLYPVIMKKVSVI